MGYEIVAAARFVLVSGLIAAAAMLVFVSSNSKRRRILLVPLLVAFIAAYPMARFFLGGVGFGNRTFVYATGMFIFAPWIYVVVSVAALVGQRVLRENSALPVALTRDPWPRYNTALSLALLNTWFTSFNIVGILTWFGGIHIATLLLSIPYIHLWSSLVVDAVLITILLANLRVGRWLRFDAKGAGIVAFGNALLMGAMLFRQFAWAEWYDDGELFGRLVTQAAASILMLGLIMMCPFWPWNAKTGKESGSDGSVDIQRRTPHRFL